MKRKKEKEAKRKKEKQTKENKEQERKRTLFQLSSSATMKIEKAKKRKKEKEAKRKKTGEACIIRNAFPSFIVDDDETWKSSKKQEQKTKNREQHIKKNKEQKVYNRSKNKELKNNRKEQKTFFSFSFVSFLLPYFSFHSFLFVNKEMEPRQRSLQKKFSNKANTKSSKPHNVLPNIDRSKMGRAKRLREKQIETIFPLKPVIESL